MGNWCGSYNAANELKGHFRWTGAVLFINKYRLLVFALSRDRKKALCYNWYQIISIKILYL